MRYTPENYLEAYAGKHCLITGGMGFIGSNLARRLVELEAQVTLVDSLIPTYGGNLFNIHGIEDKVRVNIADVRDENSMDYLVRGQDYIFSLAGQISHLDSMHDPYTDLEINCRSQLSLLEACRKNNPGVKVVYAGTRQIYGNPDYLPVDENHLVRPTDVNGINKAAGERYYLVYASVYGLRTASLRLTNCYGPRQWMRDNRLTSQGWLLRLVLDNKTAQIFGDGQQLRDLNYVDDVVDALLRAAALDEANGHFFNLGGKPYSLLEQVQIMIELAGTGSYELVPWPEERKNISIGNYYGDYSKIKRMLGWEPKVEIREGLSRTIEYYREYQQHYW
ncbi:MAG TPA: NAD-dependent epimerase/dehydratase family protein [Chloroflexia bacterium]|nr:NAD-dependent epimerase/dehydratase family protein [Chloroflexia bacterium]